MNAQKLLSEQLIWLIKNNRFFAYIIVFGVIVISIGVFTDAVKKIIYFFSEESPEDARIKLAQMKFSFEPATFRKCVESKGEGRENMLGLLTSKGLSRN